MADGHFGEPGADVVLRVVVVHKHACVVVPILLHQTVVQVARDLVPRFSLAATISAQVK